MKKIVFFLCIFFITLSAVTGCSQPQDTLQTSERDTAEIISDATEPETPSAQIEVQDADFYSICTNYSKTEVEQFAAEVKDFILASDWAALSERVAYPVTMGGVVYEDSAAFVNAPFETMLHTEAIEAIRREACTDMFCNYAGIMMGNGEVWIGEVLHEDFTSAGLHVIGLHILKSEQTPSE